MREIELITSAGGLISVGISLWSLKVAMRAERGQREAMDLAEGREHRNSVAMHLQKYSDLLAEVRDASKAAKLEIHTAADEALGSLCTLVDGLTSKNQPRPSRHLLCEMGEKVFESFAPELSFQYEENILHRYAGVRRRLREISKSCKDHHMDAAVSGLERFVHRPVPRRTSPESRLLLSKEFFELYSDLDSRLGPAVARRLLLASVDFIENFREAQRRLIPVFESCRDRLEAALDRNSAEEFKVRESPGLWSKVEWEIRALGLMARLGLGDIKKFRNHDALDALPEFVHAGAMLHTITVVADCSRYSSEPMRY